MAGGGFSGGVKACFWAVFEDGKRDNILSVFVGGETTGGTNWGDKSGVFGCNELGG